MKITFDAKKLLFILVTVVVVLLVTATVRAVVARHRAFANCTEAKAAHMSSIPKSSPYYKPSLDRNHDGYACQ